MSKKQLHSDETELQLFFLCGGWVAPPIVLLNRPDGVGWNPTGETVALRQVIADFCVHGIYRNRCPL